VFRLNSEKLGSFLAFHSATHNLGVWRGDIKQKVRRFITSLPFFTNLFQTVDVLGKQKVHVYNLIAE
jgi:hypothetical protein